MKTQAVFCFFRSATVCIVTIIILCNVRNVWLMPYKNAWVKSVRLDQSISNSAFNNCSVTVIYSGVIITDVLLLCDWPVPPHPYPHRSVPTWSCFMGLLQPLLLWCFSIFVVSSSAKCKFASVASLWDTSHRVSCPTGLSNLVWETIAYPSAHTSITVQRVQTG